MGRLFVASLVAVLAGLVVPALAVKLVVVMGLPLMAVAVMEWGMFEIGRGGRDG